MHKKENAMILESKVKSHSIQELSEGINLSLHPSTSWIPQKSKCNHWIDNQCWGGRSSVGELQVCQGSSYGEGSCLIVEWSSDLNGWDVLYR